MVSWQNQQHALWRATLTGVLAVNCLVTLSFDGATSYVTRGMVAFITTWLSSCKVVALYCGRGPLASHAWSRAQFVAIYALPLLPAAVQEAGSSCGGGGSDGPPQQASSGSSSAAAFSNSLSQSGTGGHAAKGSSDDSSTGGGSLLARSAAKTALCAAALLGVSLGPPHVLKEVLYVLAMYCWLGCAMDAVACLAFTRLGLRLDPHFRPPWQATTISGFWGRHWNLAASSAVRTTVYEPICEGAWLREQQQQQQQQQRRGAQSAPGVMGQQPEATQQRRQRRKAAEGPPASSRRTAAALCAACTTSGVVHEAIVWYIAGCTTGGAWLAFFSIQGPLILAERWVLHRLARAGIKLPAPLRVAATLGSLLALSHFLFFLPAERIDLVHDFVARMRRNFAGLAAAAAPVGRRLG